jgi:group I intron endonuclease
MSEWSNIKTGVYKIRNLITDDCYVGSAAYSFNKRWNTHKHQLKNNKHHSIILQRAWNKYGEKNFKFEIIECCEPSDCLVKKQHYLDNLKPKYNIHLNAESPLGRKLKLEHCKKISDRTIGEKNSFFGKHHTEETKKLLSEKLKGKNKGKYLAEKNPMYKKTHSDENKKIMSIASNHFWNSEDGVKLKQIKSKEKLGKSNQFAKKGKDHPNFISTIYRFFNKQLNEEFIGTMFDFRKKYKLCSDVYYLLDGKKKKYQQYKGWAISYEK